MTLQEFTMMRKLAELNDYIRERNLEQGLDAPEKRLEALGARMKAAKQAEALRVAAEGRAAA